MKSLFLAMVFALMSFGAQANVTLSCAGTEPFWDAAINGKFLWVNKPEYKEAMALKMLNRTEARGYAPGYVFVVKTRYSRLTVINGTCNDGMSDHEYSHHAVLEHNGEVLAGCCDMAK
jgi:uncharacterized membrane protein